MKVRSVGARRGPWPPRKPRPAAGDPRGHLIVQGYLHERARAKILRYLESVRPIWEFRFPLDRPPPRGETQRRLLRPVYWLGNWQFACLDYYRTPKGIFE